MLKSVILCDSTFATRTRQRYDRIGQVGVLLAVSALLPCHAVHAQKLLATLRGSQPGENFGWGGSGEGVAISGGTVIISAARRGTYGAADVFDRNRGNTNTWQKVATLSAFDGSPGELFSWSVDVSGDTTIVAEHRNSGGASMYVFERNQAGSNMWGGVARLSPTPANGSSVSIDNDTAIAGSAYANGVGAAYIFARHEGGQNSWGQIAELTASDAMMGDPNGFGAVVAIAGGIAVVAAPEGSVTGGDSPGSVYIFQRDEADSAIWREVTKLTSI